MGGGFNSEARKSRGCGEGELVHNGEAVCGDGERWWFFGSHCGRVESSQSLRIDGHGSLLYKDSIWGVVEIKRQTTSLYVMLLMDNGNSESWSRNFSMELSIT